MSFAWVESNIYEPFPTNAVWCSKDKHGSNIYFGKLNFEQSVLAVKIVPQKREASVPYEGRVLPALNFKVLVNTTCDHNIWVNVINGNLPSEIVECGYDRKHNKLFVGRAFHKGYLIPGHVHSVTKLIHIPYKGKEYKYREYEVLSSHTLKTKF